MSAQSEWMNRTSNNYFHKFNNLLIYTLRRSFCVFILKNNIDVLRSTVVVACEIHFAFVASPTNKGIVCVGW
jgi:hypothetical protein